MRQDGSSWTASVYAKGLGSFLHKQNLRRHANSKEHNVAQRAWEAQKLAPGIETINNTLESATLASTPAASAKDKAASTKSLFPTTAHRAVVATRALLETSGSFRSFDIGETLSGVQIARPWNPAGIAGDW